MTFTNDERRLLVLYHSGSLADTADTFRLALRDAADPDERAVVTSVLRKLDGMDETAFDGLGIESERLYG